LKKYLIGCTSCTIGGISLKLLFSHFSCMHYKRKFGYDRSRSKHILFKKKVTCRLCHSIASSLSTCATYSAIFVVIGPQVREFYLWKTVPVRLYLSSHSRDFPEPSYLALHTHALQVVLDWLVSVKK